MRQAAARHRRSRLTGDRRLHSLRSMVNDDSPTPLPASEDANDSTPSEAAPRDSTPAGDDQTLTCVQCGAQFVFSADEQQFFKERNLTSPPKRCKACRAERRKSRRGGGRKGRMKDYRGPAFRDRRNLDKMYRSPAFQKKQDVDGIYRSPAFQDREDTGEDVYRSPGFQDTEDVSEIYRGPAFQPSLFDDDEQPEATAEPEGEHDLEQGPPPGYKEPSSPHEIYRSPAFSDTDPANYAPSYRKRQMHDIICADCGKPSRVPFKPQKDRPVYCKECFAKRK